MPLVSRMLLRHYIGKRQGDYYAQSCNKVVGTLSAEHHLDNHQQFFINFKWLLGEQHYQYKVHQNYQNQAGQWMTPVELFRPYYSYCFADFVANDIMKRKQQTENHHHHNHCDGYRPIRIIELGPGRGTNALCFLDRWKHAYPQLYKERLKSYTLIDSSPTLHQLQQEVLTQAHGHEKTQFLLKDLMTVAEGNTTLLDTSDDDEEEENEADTYVMAFEVFDNLPHDKIKVGGRRSNSFNDIYQTELQRSKVILHEQPPTVNELEELYVTLNDPLLEHILRTISTGRNSQQLLRKTQYIPSVACGIIRHILKDIPRSRIIVADFDWLPPPEEVHSYRLEQEEEAKMDTSHDNTLVINPKPLPIDNSIGAPLVTSMEDKDYGHILDSPHLSDIMFTTNFELLASYVRGLTRNINAHDVKVVQVSKQSDFVQTHGKEHVKSTKSFLTGYSPLVSDFSNCSILTVI